MAGLQEVVGQDIPICLLLPAELHVLVLVVFRGGSEHIEEAFAGVTDLQHAGHVSASVAVVGRAPHGAQPIVVEHLEALLTQLMGSQDVVHIVHCEELLNHLGAECISSTARGEAELVPLGIGVGPYKVGHGSFVGDLPEAVDNLDLIDRVDRRRQTWQVQLC